MSVLNFYQKKQQAQKISMVTCYDYSSAKLVAQSEVDAVLVGDSVAMTMHGYENTTYASVEMMCLHTKAVKRGLGKQFLVTDLPFLSYRKSQESAMHAVDEIMRSGAEAIKLEGAVGNLDLIKHIVQSGVPVMGHLGLTPQFVHQFGGFKVQGRDEFGAQAIFEDAMKLQDAGCFALVLECVPEALAAKVTKALAIPTIGIGAGPATDGQILVYQDLLGMSDMSLKFVKQYAKTGAQIISALNQYVSEVSQEEFPAHAHCFNA